MSAAFLYNPAVENARSIAAFSSDEFTDGTVSFSMSVYPLFNGTTTYLYTEMLSAFVPP